MVRPFYFLNIWQIFTIFVCMLDLNTIYAILRQVSKDFVPIKCFAVLDDLAHVNDDNFGLSYQDYQAGFYWAKGGISRENNTKEYPALVVENVKSATAESVFKNIWSYRVPVSIMQPVPCDDCEETIPEIDILNESYLRSIIKELFTYHLYNDNGDKVWLSEARATSQNLKSRSSSLQSKLSTSQLDIFTSGGNIDELRIKSVMLDIKGCRATDGEFDYSQTEYDQATVKCSVC